MDREGAASLWGQGLAAPVCRCHSGMPYTCLLAHRGPAAPRVESRPPPHSLRSVCPTQTRTCPQPGQWAQGRQGPEVHSLCMLFSFTQQDKLGTPREGRDGGHFPCPGPLGSGPRRRSFGKDTAGTGRGWNLPHLSPEARTCPLALFGISEAGGSLPARPGAGLGPAGPGRTGLSSRASPVSSLGSLLVVIGGVGKGELEAVGLGQQQADVLVIPEGCGQVLRKSSSSCGERTGWSGRHLSGESPASPRRVQIHQHLTANTLPLQP